MKVLFLTDNFPPEYNAPATRTFEHCKEWVKNGVEVTVVTCFPNFPSGKIYKGYKNKLYSVEYIDNIKVVRVWSYITSNSGFFKRTLDFISYAISAFIASLFIKTDIIIATSPQFFTAVSGSISAFFKRKKWIMEVRDIWPESISAVNAVKSSRVISFLERVEMRLYRSASRIIVVTDSFKEILSSRGVSSGKIAVIKNGVDRSKFVHLPKDEELCEKLNLDNIQLVVGYIGTHGMAHSLPFVIDSIHKGQFENITFVFIGDGAVKSEIVNQTESLGLKNILFLNPVSKNQISRYLSLIDIALVPLKKSDTFKSVIPSKIFESASMGKPVLLGVDGETRKMIETYNSGLYYEPENTADFIQKLKELASSYSDEKYVRGCEALASEYDRIQLADDMLKEVENTLNQSR